MSTEAAKVGENEVYPNSPLKSVVFEIRFPGEPAVECHRDVFFEKVRGEFPQVFVPKVAEGAAVALSPYHFVSTDAQRALLTAINLFAFRTTAYAEFADFRAQTLRWLKCFSETYEIKPLTRTGLRYTNVIPFAPGAAFPVTQFLRVNVAFGDAAIRQFGRFYLAAEFPSASGSLTIQLGSPIEGQQENTMILDFDFAKTGDLAVRDVEQYLDESHAETKRLFESLLTDEYRSYLRGEVLT